MYCCANKVSCRCLDRILVACVAQFVFAVLIGNVFGSVQIDLRSGSFSLQPACGQLVRAYLVYCLVFSIRVSNRCTVLPHKYQ